MIRRIFTGVFLALCAPAAQLAAQAPQPAELGNFSTVPFLLIYEQANPETTSLAHVNSLHQPGVLADMPGGTSSKGDFRPEIIRQGLQTALNPGSTSYPVTFLEIDGISSGNGILPLTYDASAEHFHLLAPVQPNTAWAAMFFSVKHPDDAPVGSVLRTQMDFYGAAYPGREIGSEVVGYYAPSSVIPEFIDDNSYLEMSQLLVDLSSVSVDGQARLQAMDLAAPHIAIWPGAAPPPEIPNFTRVAFSLTQACVDEMNTLRPSTDPASLPTDPPTGQNKLLHGTSVIVAEWGGSSWNNFHVIFDHTFDDVSPTDPGMILANDEVDAVELGPVPAGIGSVLGSPTAQFWDYLAFSLDRAGEPITNTELLIYAPTQQHGSPIAELYSGPGSATTVLERVGIENHMRITSICKGDPEGVYPGNCFSHPVKGAVPTSFPSPTRVLSMMSRQTFADINAPRPTTTLRMMTSGAVPYERSVQLLVWIGASVGPALDPAQAVTYTLPNWPANFPYYYNELKVIPGGDYQALIRTTDAQTQSNAQVTNVGAIKAK